MFDMKDFLQIANDYDFKKLCIDSIEKLKTKIERNPKLVEDITDFNICDLYYVDKEGEEIKNFIRYKLINDIYNGTLVDCDNLMLTKKILAMLLYTQGIKINKISLKDNTSRIFNIEESVELETDTMNSFLTIFNIFFEQYICKDIDSKCMQCYGKTTAKLKRYWLLKNASEIFSENNLNRLELEFSGITNCFIELRKFAILTHSIGNFTLVPKKYNWLRYSITKDCWDLSLMDLQNNNNKYTWYCDNIHLFLYNNYFNNYDKSIIFKNLEVKPLYQNHSFKNKLPTNIHELYEYIKNINKCIIYRGEKIIKQLISQSYVDINL